MLVQLHSAARECYRRAAEAHNRAMLTTDSEYKAFLLEMEGRWVALASSLQFSERIERASTEQAERLKKLRGRC